MRKTAILTAVIVAIIATSLIVSLQASGQSYNIPTWIKNNAKWWSEGQIGDSDFISGIKYLIENNILLIDESKQDNDNSLAKEYDQTVEFAIKLQEENARLESEMDALRQDRDYWKNLAGDYDECYPTTMIEGQTIYWDFCDSKGNLYSWEMPVEGYEALVGGETYLDYVGLQLPSGGTVQIIDYTKFVGNSFQDVIDDVYANAENDDQFIYEVWYIVSQLTTYSYDIDYDFPRYALETFTRGGGDCEDTAILIADMIRSSGHTRDWDVKLVYFDADNPSSPKDVDHVAVGIDTGENYYVIESTAKTREGAYSWAGQKITGWYYDV